MSGESVPDRVDQAVFGFSYGRGMELLASSSDNVASERRWMLHLERFIRLEQFNATPPPLSALSYLVMNDHEVTVLYRWYDESTTPGRNPSRALIGSPDVLSVPVALGLRQSPSWPQDVHRPLVPVPAHEVVQAGQNGLPALRQQVPQLGPDLVKVLATLIEHPERKVGIVGCPPESRVAMVLALCELAPYGADPEYHWDWSFSTHEVLDGEDVRELPMVVFLPGPPNAPPHRSIVDLAARPAASGNAID